MEYLKQVIYELKNQKMMTWVSISGTALAIFVIMAIYMSGRLKQLEIAPVSDRSRILIGQGIDYYDNDGSSASGMGIDYNLAKKLYSNLDGIERLSFVRLIWGKVEAGLPQGESFFTESMMVDDEFWKIYDYNFISGKPFEKEDVEGGARLAVLTRTMARNIFNEEDVVGREFDIDNSPYMVKGVVDDQYPLLPDGEKGLFILFKPGTPDTYYKGIFGDTNLRLKLKEGVDVSYVKQQVAKRYEDLNREYEKENKNFRYHQQPYSYEELSLGPFGSNNDPPVKKSRIESIFYYSFLLLLPAINLSSMTRSRLRYRISEIGVRRAFGAKKKNIISQIFVENFLMSVAGGIIGLIFSIMFLILLGGYFIAVDDKLSGGSLVDISILPVIWNIFNWSTFFIAIGACFVLNLLSATVPAWRASEVEPSLAISKSH